MNVSKIVEHKNKALQHPDFVRKPTINIASEIAARSCPHKFGLLQIHRQKCWDSLRL